MNEQSVVIKSNRYGITLFLDKDASFQELLGSIREKFRASSKFFKDAQMALAFEGRQLTQEEQIEVIQAIQESSGLQVLCILENDALKESYMKQIVEGRKQKSAESDGRFYKGTLRSGQVLESYSSITLIGDVNPGAKIISQGNIVILGSLKGNAHAGATGDSGCFIFALEMKPIQLQIGEYIAKSPDKEKGGRGLRKRESTAANAYSPQIATAKEETICIEPVTRGRLNNLF